MSQDETMRLVAEVVDKYSGPMKDMLNSLKKIGEGSKIVHKEGEKHAREHGKAFSELREQLNRVKDVAADSVRPALSALGISALSVAGSIAAVSDSVKSFGEYGEKLTFANRASGLLTSTVRGLAEVNQQYGVSTDDTIKSLEVFGGHMDELRRRSPIYLNEWKKFPKLWNEIGKDLTFGGLSRQNQLKKAMEFVPTIKDVDQRKRVLGLLGLPENWAYLTDQEMREMEKKAEEFNERFPFDDKAALKAKEAWDGLLSTMRGFKDTLAGDFAPGVSQWLKETTETLNNKELWKNLGDSFKDLFGDINFGLTDADKKAFSLKQNIQDLTQMMKDFHDLFLKFGIDKGGSYTSPGKTGHHAVSKDANKSETKEATEEGFLAALRRWAAETNASSFAGGYTPMAFHPGNDNVGAKGGIFGSKEYPAIGEGTGSGTTRGDRNNNPGNMKYGNFAKSHGATGQDSGGFAIFPDKATGGAAQEALVGGSSYSGLTLNQFAKKYAEGSTSWANTVGKKLGIGGNDIVNNKDPRLIEAIRQAEGTGQRRSGSADTDQGGRPGYIHGVGTMDGFGKFHWGSGGAGKGSIPYGNYPITPNTIGTWGRAHGAIGINNNSIFDPKLGQNRGGIEIHASSSSDLDRLYTLGCFAVAPSEWPAFKSHLMGEISKNGPMYLHVGKDGASITHRATTGHGARLADHIRRGARPNDASLLRRGMKATDNADFNSNAHLRVDINGAPRGTKMAMKHEGFKTATLNRGRPMGVGSET